MLNTLLSFFTKTKIENLKWLAILILATGFFASWRSCSEKQEIITSIQKTTRQNIVALSNKNQQLKVEAEKKDIKLDSFAAKIAEIAGINLRTITQYKYIEVEKRIKGDTLYELLEVSIPDGTEFKYKFDDCSTVVMKWGKPIKWALDRNMQIYDVNHFERKRLFGVKFLPRLGKKQFYQTLLTNCGDTVVNNRLITFTK